MIPKLFLLVPLLLAELVMLILVGSWLGAAPTLLTVLVTSLAGLGFAKSQGVRTLRSFRQAMAEGRLPREEIFDGLMILLAGLLLLFPGFLTDLAGIAILIPPVRRRLRKRIGTLISHRIPVVGAAVSREASRRVPDSTRAKGDIIDV